MSVHQRNAVEASGECLVADSDKTSTYPDFKEYHQCKPDVCMASKKNHIEQNFYITNRVERGNRTTVCNATCAFCLQSFSGFNATKMRVHLTGEEEAQTRVAVCKRVPKACREFYQAERDNAAAASKAKQTKYISAIKEAIHIAVNATEAKKRKAADLEGSRNARSLTASSNLRNVSSLSVERMIVS